MIKKCPGIRGDGEILRRGLRLERVRINQEAVTLCSWKPLVERKGKV